ncbi:MAG: hypothetical protein CMN76_13760 [Spirochaetaceae bacterium]|nr:hypothetical protein [Spirochaetaceae bacterium]
MVPSCVRVGWGHGWFGKDYPWMHADFAGKGPWRTEDNIESGSRRSSKKPVHSRPKVDEARYSLFGNRAWNPTLLQILQPGGHLKSWIGN